MIPVESSGEKKIGLAAATAVVVGNMVGVGVFTSLGFQVGVGGGFSLLMLWLLGGIYSLMGALCYAELASALPRSGGEYHLQSATLHPAIGFASGWLSCTVGFAAPIAFAAIAFGSYLGSVLGWEGAGQTVLGVLLILVVTACHLRDVAFGSRFQVVATSLKVALVVGLALCGFLLGKNQGMSFLPTATSLKEIGSSGFALSFYWVTFSYSGWNAAAYIVGEVRDPQRSVPRALLIGTGFVTLLYVMLNASFLYSTPVGEMAMQEEVGLIAARSIFGDTGGNLVGMLIAIGLVSAVSAMTWAGPRVGQVMGEDHPPLSFLARRTRRGIPVYAILIQSAIAILLATTQKFETVLRYIEFALVLSLAATVFGLLWMRWKMPETAAAATFRCPLFPLVPIAFLAISAYISVEALKRHPTESLWGLGTLASGFLVYLLVARRQGRPK